MAEIYLAWKDVCKWMERVCLDTETDFDYVYSRMAEIPPADVRPVVRSHWKKNDNGTYSCERCYSWIPEEQRHYANWCLYCGADMRGGDADGMYGGEVGITDVYEERARLEEENRALRTELATNHIGDVNKKGPDQEAKADAGKPRLTLVPQRIIWDIAAVRDLGTKKYKDPNNWKRVSKERYRDAAFRHFMRYLATPHGVDEESGLPHLWHCCCNLAFLCELEEGLHDKEKNL